MFDLADTPQIPLPMFLAEAARGELERGERIQWAAQPRPWRFAWRALPIVLFGIPWTAFALFWVAGAARFKIPDFSKPVDFFPLLGMPFVLMGLGMLSAPLWLVRKARRTLYVITDRRAIMFGGSIGTTALSFGPSQLTNLRRRQRPDGSGAVLFGSYSYDHDSGKLGCVVGLLGIERVKEVETMLREIAATTGEGR